MRLECDGDGNQESRDVAPCVGAALQEAPFRHCHALKIMSLSQELRPSQVSGPPNHAPWDEREQVLRPCDCEALRDRYKVTARVGS